MFFIQLNIVFWFFEKIIKIKYMKKIYAYLHTHWDREWYRDIEDFNLRLLDILDIALDEIEKGNTPFIYLDGQTCMLNDYLKYRQDKKEQITEYIKERKLFIGPYFVSIDSYIPNLYSMLRNLDLGIKISNDFGQRDFIGYMADIFGISKSAFLALKLKNIDKAIIWRGVNPKKTGNVCDFLYENIETTWLAQGYFNDFFHQSTTKENIENIKNYISKIEKYSSNNILLPIGADHLGILKNAKQKIKEINSYLDGYEIILSSPFEYFKNTKFDKKTVEIEFLDNELTYILKGCYSARIPQKIQNFNIQNKLSRIVEPLNFYLKDKFTENLDNVFINLIKNHAHDSICGTSLDSVHNCVENRFLRCNLALDAIEKRITGNFKKGNSEKITNKFGLFNLSTFDNIKTVKINLPYKLKNAQVTGHIEAFEDDLLYDTYKIPVTEDIKKIYEQVVEISNNQRFSYNNVEILEPIKKVRTTSKSIENDYIGLFIKNNKVQIFDKNKKESYEFFLSDIKDMGDSYNIAPIGKYSKYNIKKARIKYDGIIESCLTIDFGTIKLDCILDNHSKFIRFKTYINNRKKNHKIQLNLVLKDKIEKTISEDGAGIIERKIDPDYDVQKHMPAIKPIELKTNTFPVQNFVIAQDAIIFTKGLNEYEIFKNNLKITLLRSFEAISNNKNLARYVPAGPNLKTPQAQLIGRYEMEFAIAFGNKFDAFKNLDLFLQNYVTVATDKKESFKLDKIRDNSYIYGMNKNKKIIYNIETNKISLI